MGRITVHNVEHEHQVTLPDESFQLLLRLKKGVEQEEDVLKRALDWYWTYSLLDRAGSEELKLSLRECGKATQVLKQMAAAGYREDIRVTTCRALFGEQDLESIREAFDAFDAEGKGCLSKDELRKVMPLLGEDVSDDKVDELFHLIDADKSDFVEFGEFCTLVRQLNPKEGPSIFSRLQGLTSGIVETGTGITGGLTTGFVELGSGVSNISAAYSAGLSDLGATELRKAGVILHNFKAAGYEEEVAVATVRALLGDQSEEKLQQAFELFDKNGSGCIDVEELKHALPLMGENIPEEKIEEVHEICDSNKNGKVEFGEFCELVKLMNPKRPRSTSQQSGWLQLPAWLGGGSGAENGNGAAEDQEGVTGAEGDDGNAEVDGKHDEAGGDDQKARAIDAGGAAAVHSATDADAKASGTSHEVADNSTSDTAGGSANPVLPHFTGDAAVDSEAGTATEATAALATGKTDVAAEASTVAASITTGEASASAA